jgi:hypothetical protein
MNWDLAFGIFAVITCYLYPIIGGGWAYIRLLRITWRDLSRTFRAHERKRRRLIAAT